MAEVLDKKRNILLLFPEGRREDGHDIEPEIEVLPEFSSVYLFAQVLVGGGNHPDIDLADFCRANLLDFTFLEDAQDFGLCFQAHVSDFIKENRPSVGLFELAYFSFGCSREGALLVTEKLALNQLFRDGGAVDLDEFFSGSKAMIVDGPGDKLLSRAALALDEDCGIRGSSLEDFRPEFFHQGMVANELVSFLGFSAKVQALPLQLVLVQGVANRQQDSISMEGFLQELKSAKLGGLDSGLNSPLP
ncbi:MAG: hypothetical protein QHH14_01335 [Clostridiales bacterium]|nr:hypothetical protein [Clostridiales bacterium]